MDDEDVLVRLLVLRPEVGFGGVAAVAARVDTKHVDGRLALDNPFGKLPAGTAGGGDAETVTLTEPEIRQVPGRADDRIAVGRVGDGAVIDLLHPGFAESGNAVHGGFDMRLQTLQILLEKLVFGIGARPVDIACRRAGLVGAENQPAGLLAHVPAAVGVTKNAHFRQAPGVPLLDRLMRLGDDILVLDRDHRNVEPDHAARLAGEIAGCADHMLAGDLALVGGHLPFARGGARNAGDGGVAIDFGAAVAGPAGQRLRQVGRLDIAVAGMPDRADQTLGVAKRPDIAHLVGGQEIDIDPDGAGDTGILPVFVHPVGCLRQPDVADIAEADIHAGLFLKLLIEFHRIFVNLPDRIGHVEQGQQAGGMPGRSGGKLLALDQRNVGPPLLREMVQRADADNTAPDHNNACMRLHPDTSAGYLHFMFRKSTASAVSGRRRSIGGACQPHGDVRQNDAEKASAIRPVLPRLDGLGFGYV